jgi:hypothetical protein
VQVKVETDVIGAEDLTNSKIKLFLLFFAEKCLSSIRYLTLNLEKFMSLAEYFTVLSNRQLIETVPNTFPTNTPMRTCMVLFIYCNAVDVYHTSQTAFCAQKNVTNYVQKHFFFMFVIVIIIFSFKLPCPTSLNYVVVIREIYYARPYIFYFFFIY